MSSHLPRVEAALARWIEAELRQREIAPASPGHVERVVHDVLFASELHDEELALIAAGPTGDEADEGRRVVEVRLRRALAAGLESGSGGADVLSPPRVVAVEESDAARGGTVSESLARRTLSFLDTISAGPTETWSTASGRLLVVGEQGATQPLHEARESLAATSAIHLQ